VAKWAFKIATWTPVAVGDGAAMTANAFQGLVGQTATQRLDISEIYMGGQGTSSAPMYMVLARSALVGSSTAVSTIAGGNQALLDAQGSATLSSVAFTSTTTATTRASNGGLLSLSYNGFGGIVRWVAAPGSEIKQYGTAVSTGEVTLSAFTGGTPSAMGSHIVYEPY
jgi:hypothetical protein